MGYIVKNHGLEFGYGRKYLLSCTGDHDYIEKLENTFKQHHYCSKYTHKRHQYSSIDLVTNQLRAHTYSTYSHRICPTDTIPHYM